MRFVIFAISLLSLAAWGASSYYNSLCYSWNCGQYLERAANATTVGNAIENMDHALSYLDENGMTEGNTGVLWQTPKNDVGYWYKNLSDATTELQTLPEESSPMEKSNMLMKLKEAILDVGEKGTYVAQPAGIHNFPHNPLYLGWIFVTGVVLVCSGIVVFGSEKR